MVIIIIIIGLFCAYFSNLIADVLPQKRENNSIVCRYCQLSISFLDVINSRSCPSCGNKFTHFRWSLFILFPVLYTCLWFYPPDNYKFIEICLLLLYFVIVLIIDIEHKLILHQVNLAGFFLSVIIGLNHHPPTIVIAGGVSGLLIILSIYYSGQFYIYIQNKIKNNQLSENALGFGDVYFCMNIGFLLGFPKILMMVLLTIISSGIFAGFYLITMILIRRYKPYSTFPYAPFLVFSSLMMIFFFP